MVPLDAGEYARGIATARRQLAIARHAATGEFHEAAVLHPEQAVQCALKALLHAVGSGDKARGHGLVDLIAACEDTAGLALQDAVRQRSAELGAAYQPTRYPDALPGGTPEEHYGEEISARSAATADTLIGLVHAHYSALTQADDGSDGGGGS